MDKKAYIITNGPTEFGWTTSAYITEHCYEPGTTGVYLNEHCYEPGACHFSLQFNHPGTTMSICVNPSYKNYIAELHKNNTKFRVIVHTEHSPDQHVERMQGILDSPECADWEDSHVQADDCLCAWALAHGGAAIVEIYDQIPKWYA
jgi:hypothetical protein